MKYAHHKTGAVIYALWGLIHIAGGSMLLSDALSGNPGNVLKSIASALPESQIQAVAANTVNAAVLASHAFNLFWMGLVVLIIAITMNWKNSKAGLLFNTAIIGFADIGLIAFLLIPGYVKFEEGIIGPILWPLGMFFLLLGLRNNKKCQPAFTTIN